MQLEEEIRTIIEKESEDYFLGTADLSVSSDPKICQYGSLITEYPRAISFGITLPCINTYKSFKDYSKIYKFTNCKLRSISSHLSNLLENKGYKAFPVPKSKIVDVTFTSLHNLAANMANMGKVEKNGLIVTPEVGYGVNWGTVLTDASF
ncbi:MAG: 4Fe-4S ferredoxin [Methanobacterium sp.]